MASKWIQVNALDEEWPHKHVGMETISSKPVTIFHTSVQQVVKYSTKWRRNGNLSEWL